MIRVNSRSLSYFSRNSRNLYNINGFRGNSSTATVQSHPVEEEAVEIKLEWKECNATESEADVKADQIPPKSIPEMQKESLVGMRHYDSK
ncbi:hypothetical protein BCR33DRAFT_716300 [Rhizoclosmatium globosum]|uniref:Uncharacterized protein n=1 Tax=Rhizoclosmatium globosum TaxID=329046 RepID=A0A1Y2CH65_9FUNG|nr:hypothetical protein BCR33DRAFT_716300 [Rhizoclosmatium globosum]|eukprot:ORY45655.1 hypothetical protein BCR33DRAFT_716300 [Rhizoclosmatium globosum]